MFPTADVGIAISSFSIPDRHFRDSQILFGGPENEIKVTEWIKVSKVGSILRNQFIVGFAQNLGAAESVLDGLPEEPGKTMLKNLLPTRLKKRMAFSSMG